MGHTKLDTKMRNIQLDTHTSRHTQRL